MAQRFGGPNSPGGDPRPASRQASGARPAAPRLRVSPVGARVNLLFALPFPWAFSAFFRDPTGLVQHLAVFAILMLSAWLTRDGVIAHDAYDLRRVSRRPAIPRKLFGAVLMGAGLALAGWGSAYGLVAPVVFGLVGAGLHLASFGLDPLRDKGLEGVDEFQTDRVARAVEGAEAYLRAMTDAMLRARDRKLDERLAQFHRHVRALLKAVEDDPSDLSAARRYLGIYLEGARDATVKFADLYAVSRDPEARVAYVALLDDLETNFALRTEALRANDRDRMEIEVDVLRERLAREGAAPQPAVPPAPNP